MPTPNTIIGRYPTTQQFDDFLQLIDRNGGNTLGGIDGHGYRYGTLAAGDFSGVAQKTADYTVLSTDNGVLVSMSSGVSTTVTLPATPPASPFVIYVQNTGAGTLTISPNSNQIDGASSSLTLLTGQGIMIASNGTAYFTERGSGGTGTGFAGVASKTADYTAVSGDTGKLVTFNSNSAVTLTLPVASPGSTWFIYVQNRGTGFLTINRNGLNIDGAASNIGLLQKQGVIIFSDGTNYFTDRGVSGVGNVNVQVADYTAVVGDAGKLISFNKATAVALTLPATSPGPAFVLLVQNVGAGTLTINRNGNNIDGAASNITLTTNQGLIIYSDGTNYFTERGSGSTASNVAIKPAAAVGVQYITQQGDDTSDGLSWGTSKKTIMAGYDALPSGGGTLFILGQGTDSTEWPSATSTSGQGIWLMGTNDPNYSSPPAGWRKAKSGENVQVAFVGVPSSLAGGNNVVFNQSVFLGGDSSNPAIWLSGVSGVSFSNLFTQYPKSFAWIGINSNSVKNDNAGGSVIVFENCGANVQGGTSAYGPVVDIGPNLFWLRFSNCGFQANLLADESSDNRCAILIKEGIPPVASITQTSLTGNVATYTAAHSFVINQRVTITGCTNNVAFNGTFSIGEISATTFGIGITHANIAPAAEAGTATPIRYNSASAILYFENCHFTGGGGIRYYNQHEATGSQYIRNCESEGTGDSQPLYEVMTNEGAFFSNAWFSEGIADSSDLPPIVKVADGVQPYRVNVYANLGFTSVGLEGPMTVYSSYGSQQCVPSGSINGRASGRCSPLAKRQMGMIGNHLFGGSDAGRRLGFAQVRWINRASQLPSAWTTPGGATLTTGITAPDLTTNAATVIPNSGQNYAQCASITRTFLPGDYVYAGVWVKTATCSGILGGTDNSGFAILGSGDPSPDFRLIAGSQNAYTTGNTNGNFYNYPFHQTDGDWQWIWTIVKCRVQQVGYGLNMRLRAANSGGIDYSMSYYAPVLMHIPLTDLTNQSPLTVDIAGNSGATESGHVCTIKTTAAHHLAQGQIIVMSGVTASGYNGEFVVASVPSSTTFTYYNDTTGLSTSGSGTVYVSADSEAAHWALTNSPISDDLSASPLVTTLRGVPIGFGGTGDNFHAILDHTVLTANRTILVPDAGGTMVLTGSANIFSAQQSFGGNLKLGSSGTVVSQMVVYSASLTPALVAANITAEQTFAVTGISTSDKLFIDGPAPTAGTGIVGVRASNTDEIAIAFINATAGGLTPTAGTYKIFAIRS